MGLICRRGSGRRARRGADVLALDAAQLEIIGAIGARLPIRMRTTYLLEVAAAIDGRAMTAADLHRVALEVARRVVYNDHHARGIAGE
jgi:hypothetical protein